MAGDAYYESVSLLLHCDGTDGSTTFTDSGPNAKTVTRSGDAHIETDNKKFGTASAYFDGTGDYLTYPNDSTFTFGTGDFTIECWAYLPSVASQKTIICIGTYTATSGIILYVTDGKISAYTVSSSHAEASASVTANTWHHLAWTRDSGTLRMFVDGVKKYEGAYTNNLSSSSNNLIGKDHASTSYNMYGYLDDFRITKGVARYTADFTSPSAAFPNFAGQIAGTVLDDAGDPVARAVRAYRRDTGALVGNTTSSAGDGSYSMDLPSLAECTVICLDDAGGNDYNDLVLRVTPA